MTTGRDDLLAAYRRAIYRAHLPEGDLDLRVGERSPALDRALRARGAARWLWLTAVNPGSRRLGAAENAARLRELEAAIRAAGWPVWLGTALDPDGAWPPEPSFLVLDPDFERALALARGAGQLAVLAGASGAEVGLVVVAGEDGEPRPAGGRSPGGGTSSSG
jgi:hypothetical protein